MTAERLRQAAEVLRARAEVATPGPWVVSRSGSIVCADHPQATQSARAVAKADDDWIDHRSNAAYIAMMTPSVALALADWLTWTADLSESTRISSGMKARALAVAGAILGDAA